MEVDDMPFPRALELFQHWQDEPPVSEMLHMLAGAFTSWKPGNRRQVDSAEKIAGAVAEMGGAVMPLAELPEWMRVSLENYKPEGKPN